MQEQTRIENTSEGPFLTHARDQVTWRLLEKAESAIKIGNYGEVMKIAATQYAFNLGALNVYYDMLKGDAYDRLMRLSGTALEVGVPEEVRAKACIAELKLLSTYYSGYFTGRIFDRTAIKK